MKKASKAPAKPKADGYLVAKDFFIRDGIQGVKGDHVPLPEAVAEPLIASGHIKHG